MISIDEYIKPSSVEEAYEILSSDSNSVILGGGIYLRLGSRHISKMIDLSSTGLKFINETMDKIEIGAMTTFREIETSEILKNNFSGVVPKSISHILGVQIRNIVTAGGSVYGRYGFSDFITVLLALDTHVELHEKGIISLEDFLAAKLTKKDILKKIIINKDKCKAAFQTMRNSSTDFAILDAAVSRIESRIKISVGARPGIASLAKDAMRFLSVNSINERTIEAAAKMAADEVTFGNDLRASKEYREELCYVLVKRAMMEVAG